MTKVLKIVGPGADNTASVAVLGRQFIVKDGIVQCTAEERDTIADELRDHGFRIVETEQAVPQQPGVVHLAVKTENGWAIMDGDTVLVDGVPEDDALFFNEGSPPERARFVAHLKAKKAKYDAGGDVVPLQAVHRGGGRYAVMRGDEKLFDGMTREEAEVFNAQSVADREALLELALAASKDAA